MAPPPKQKDKAAAKKKGQKPTDAVDDDASQLEHAVEALESTADPAAAVTSLLWLADAAPRLLRTPVHAETLRGAVLPRLIELAPGSLPPLNLALENVPERPPGLALEDAGTAAVGSAGLGAELELRSATAVLHALAACMADVTCAEEVLRAQVAQRAYALAESVLPFLLDPEAAAARAAAIAEAEAAAGRLSLDEREEAAREQPIAGGASDASQSLAVSRHDLSASALRDVTGVGGGGYGGSSWDLSGQLAGFGLQGDVGQTGSRPDGLGARWPLHWAAVEASLAVVAAGAASGSAALMSALPARTCVPLLLRAATPALLTTRPRAVRAALAVLAAQLATLDGRQALHAAAAEPLLLALCACPQPAVAAAALLCASRAALSPDCRRVLAGCGLVRVAVEALFAAEPDEAMLLREEAAEAARLLALSGAPAAEEAEEAASAAAAGGKGGKGQDRKGKDMEKGRKGSFAKGERPGSGKSGGAPAGGSASRAAGAPKMSAAAIAEAEAAEEAEANAARAARRARVLALRAAHAEAAAAGAHACALLLSRGGAEARSVLAAGALGGLCWWLELGVRRLSDALGREAREKLCAMLPPPGVKPPKGGSAAGGGGSAAEKAAAEMAAAEAAEQEAAAELLLGAHQYASAVAACALALSCALREPRLLPLLAEPAQPLLLATKVDSAGAPEAGAPAVAADPSLADKPAREAQEAQGEEQPPEGTRARVQTGSARLTRLLASLLALASAEPPVPPDGARYAAAVTEWEAAAAAAALANAPKQSANPTPAAAAAAAAAAASEAIATARPPPPGAPPAVRAAWRSARASGLAALSRAAEDATGRALLLSLRAERPLLGLALGAAAADAAAGAGAATAVVAPTAAMPPPSAVAAGEADEAEQTRALALSALAALARSAEARERLRALHACESLVSALEKSLASDDERAASEARARARAEAEEAAKAAAADAQGKGPRKKGAPAPKGDESGGKGKGGKAKDGEEVRGAAGTPRADGEAAVAQSQAQQETVASASVDVHVGSALALVALLVDEASRACLRPLPAASGAGGGGGDLGGTDAGGGGVDSAAGVPGGGGGDGGEGAAPAPPTESQEASGPPPPIVLLSRAFMSAPDDGAEGPRALRALCLAVQGASRDVACAQLMCDNGIFMRLVTLSRPGSDHPAAAVAADACRTLLMNCPPAK